MIGVDSLRTGSTQIFNNYSIFQMFRSEVMSGMSDETRDRLDRLITSSENTYHLDLSENWRDMVYIPFILNSRDCHVITERYEEVYELFRETLLNMATWTSPIVSLDIVNNVRSMHERSDITGLYRELCIFRLNDNPDIVSGIRRENVNSEISLVIIDSQYESDDIFDLYSKDTIKVKLL